MSRRSLLITFIFFLALTGFWFFSLRKDIKKTQDLVTEQQVSVPKNISPKTSTSEPAIKDSQRRKEQLKRDLQTLRQSLQSEEENLTQKNSELANLQSRLTARQSGAYLTYFGSQIQTRDGQIQELLSGMRDYRQAEEALNQRAQQELRQQDSALRVARDQVDEYIRTQEELIHQTEQELNYWTWTFNYTPERLERLSTLQSLLEAQRQRLQDMRAQRVDLSSQVLLRTQGLQSEVESLTTNYSQERDAIYDEVGGLREEIRQLEQAQSQVRNSQASLSAQMIQAQRESQAQGEKVKKLQESIREKEDEIANLQ